VLSLPVLLGLLLASGIPLTRAVLALPFLIGIEFVLILGFAFPVAIINVWFRDTQHLLRIALQLLFYMTPIFYDTAQVPASLQLIYQLNPLAHLIDAFRSVLLRGALPAMGSVLYLFAASLVLCTASMVWFDRVSHRFADEL
jgi:lipopolysaccharide transport system permease protein